jgi:hypothetical protein
MTSGNVNFGDGALRPSKVCCFFFILGPAWSPDGGGLMSWRVDEDDTGSLCSVRMQDIKLGIQTICALGSELSEYHSSSSPLIGWIPFERGRVDIGKQELSDGCFLFVANRGESNLP